MAAEVGDDRLPRRALNRSPDTGSQHRRRQRLGGIEPSRRFGTGRPGLDRDHPLEGALAAKGMVGRRVIRLLHGWTRAVCQAETAHTTTRQFEKASTILRTNVVLLWSPLVNRPVEHEPSEIGAVELEGDR